MSNKKQYMVVNQHNNFVKREDYDGAIRVVEKFSDDCIFASLNTARRLAYALNAISELHHNNQHIFKIVEHDTRIKEIDASVPDNQRESFGLPAKSEAPAAETE